ncbi:hypothetical protein BHM03_00008983, partial [Ensete ventricosum]
FPLELLIAVASSRRDLGFLASVMDAQRALLDELMGAGESLAALSVASIFSIDSIPPLWFPQHEISRRNKKRGTRRSGGTTRRSAAPICFEKSPRHDAYVPRFEAELAQFCEKLVDMLNAEKTALTQQSANDKAMMLPQEKKMALCEICGSFLVANDAAERTQTHVSGKQHIGYGMVRDYLSEFKAAKEKAKEEEKLTREKETEERKKVKDKDPENKVRERDLVGRERSRERERERDRYKDRSSERERSRDWSGRGSRDGGRGLDRRHDYHRNGRESDRDRFRDRSGARSRSRSPARHGYRRSRSPVRQY